MFESINENNPEKITVFEDEKDRIIKGFSLHGNNRDNSDKNSYEIFALYIQPEFIRTGVGSLLIAGIENGIDKNAYNQITIWTLERNEKAIRFYEKNGYAKSKRKKLNESWNEWEIELIKNLSDK